MPEEYVCKSISEVFSPGSAEPLLMFSQQKPDGSMHHYMVPKHTMAARAIEYDMDPVEDFDDLLDIVLHEPFVDEDDIDDPAVAEGYATEVAGRRVAANLWTAETIQDAREAHLLRVQKAKRERTQVTISPDLVDKVKSSSGLGRPKVRGLMSAAEPVHPALDGLKERVAAQRRKVRGREDGSPLKAKIDVRKEG